MITRKCNKICVSDVLQILLKLFKLKTEEILFHLIKHMRDLFIFLKQ